MALKDTLADIRRTAPAAKNRVDILRDELTGEDAVTLERALRSPSITGAALTKALRKEYGEKTVTDTSVDSWRRKNLAEVTGL